MATNDLVLLDQVLQQRQTERPTPIPDDDAFELFACEQALRDLDLSVEEVAEGVVGGGNDGGLDGVYVFLGDALLSEDSDVFQEDFNHGKVPARTLLELWMVQAKRETSFTETAVEKAADSSRRLLSLTEDFRTMLERMLDEHAQPFLSPGRRLAIRPDLTLTASGTSLELASPIARTRVEIGTDARPLADALAAGSLTAEEIALQRRAHYGLTNVARVRTGTLRSSMRRSPIA